VKEVTLKNEDTWSTFNKDDSKSNGNEPINPVWSELQSQAIQEEKRQLERQQIEEKLKQEREEKLREIQEKKQEKTLTADEIRKAEREAAKKKLLQTVQSVQKEDHRHIMASFEREMMGRDQ
jgi:hypothetical protein